MSREFHSLDRLRLDKYLFLIRCYVGVGFEIFLNRESLVTTTRSKVNSSSEHQEEKEKTTPKKRKREEGDSPVDQVESAREASQESNTNGCRDLETYVDMLEEGPLCPFNFPIRNEQAERNKLSTSQHGETEMPKGPDGLRYHLMDIWVDEIAKVATETETPSAPRPEKGEAEEGEEEGGEEAETRTRLKEGIPIELLLRPMQRLRIQSQSKAVRKRAGKLFADERFVQWGVSLREKNGEGEEGNGDEGADDEEWQGIDD
jgi:ribosomal RNA-processing protein 1